MEDRISIWVRNNTTANNNVDYYCHSYSTYCDTTSPYYSA